MIMFTDFIYFFFTKHLHTKTENTNFATQSINELNNSYLPTMVNETSVGASGAIFGLIGAIVAFALYNNQTALLQSLVNVIILNLVIGFSQGSNIDNSGHIGGLIGGGLIGFFLLAI